MSDETPQSGRNTEQAQRLKRLRESMGYATDTAWAAFLGVPIQRWSNVANGMPLSRDLAFRIVQKVPGLTLDWLYFGKSDGLPMVLARHLGETDLPRKSTTLPS